MDKSPVRTHDRHGDAQSGSATRLGGEAIGECRYAHPLILIRPIVPAGSNNVGHA
jgi:hypothetical protein